MARKPAVGIDLEQLHGLSRSELQERWRAVFGQSPPPKIDRSLLIYGVAYRIQEKAYGGLRPAARRALAKITEQAHTGKLSKRAGFSWSHPSAFRESQRKSQKTARQEPSE